jgi:hypothetical protein
VCSGLAVKLCDHGMIGEQIADCTAAGACSDGRCISPECAAAEAKKTVVGCRFFTVEADNVDTDAYAATAFVVTNPGADPATVSLEQAISAGVWGGGSSMTVGPGASLRVPVAGLQFPKSGLSDSSALRLISNRPVTIAQIESDDLTHDATSSGGTMLLPEHVLGNHYFVMAYPHQRTTAIMSLPGGPSGAGRILIVGTKNNTRLMITPPKRAESPVSLVVMGILPSVFSGQTYTTPLNEGEVFQAFTGAEGEDLSGTEIRADLPVAVFSGNITTTYGRDGEGLHSPDLAHEEMPPVYAWSYKYVAAALQPQAGCQSWFGQTGTSVWRLVASTNGTRVDIAGPNGPIGSPITLDAGGVTQLTAVGDFVVTSKDGPLLMTQGMDCEPSLSLAISADEFLDDLTFAVLPSFEHVVAIARERGQPVTLDGSPVTGFVSAGGGFEVARVTLDRCDATEGACTHRLQGRFGMTMRGMDVVASYALTPPALSGCVDTANPLCPQ